MNKKNSNDASISAAIRDIIGDTGVPLHRETRDTHLDLQRTAENASWRSGGTPGGKTLHLPVDRIGKRALAVGTPGSGGEFAGEVTLSPVNDLLAFSACVDQGCQLISGLGPDTKIPIIVGLSQPEWVAENAAPTLGSGDLVTEQRTLRPFRVASTCIISNQLLVQTGRDTDEIILNTLGMQLSSRLDEAALMGDGVLRPLGIANHPGTIKHNFAAGGSLFAFGLEMEESVAMAGTGIGSLGSIVAPALWRRLRSESAYGPGATGGPLCSMELTRVLPTPEVPDTTWYCANWSCMTIGIFSLEMIIDRYSLSLNGQTRILSSLYCDVVLRVPGAFSVSSAPVTFAASTRQESSNPKKIPTK